MKKTALKNRIKSFWGKHKTAVFVVFLSFQLAIGLTIYFLFGRVSPNDRIFIPEEGSVAFLVNQNPKFSVDFGKVKEPQEQWVRFEAQTSGNNPFEEEEGDIFTKIGKLFQKKERYGIEMSLVGVDLSKTNLEKYGDEVMLVADVIGTESIKTTTELVDLGREIGVYDDNEVAVSKQTVLNKDVADGVNLEYQILKGVGLKEEIVVRDLEAYRNDCKKSDCKLPLNEFVFDLKMDSGVELKEGWFTVDGQSRSTYYFVDSKGRYIAHFLPSFAVDGAGYKTYDVDLDVEKVEEDNYRVKVTVDTEWLLSKERVFPVRIDPSIVHDDTTDFSTGIFRRSESVAGPKIQTKMTSGLDCTGGTTYMSGVYTVHAFTSSGTLLCTSSGSADVLVVAGGGGGGNAGGGGGGAGGVILSTSFSVSSGSTSVTVGTGGAAHTNGNNSVFSTITATGGGRGGTYSGAGTRENGATGGSGGGGSISYPDTPGVGGSGTSGQGYAGGTGGVSTAPSAAGGGGKSAVGGDGVATGVGGAGGAGVDYSSYFGTDIGASGYFGGGGGGGNWNGSYAGGMGGAGGGGNGINNNGTANAGTANTGGGGGGAGSGGTGGAGGSGIVLVRYIRRLPPYPYSEYTSPSMDMGSTMSGATLSWTPSGVNTGGGETPYSTTGLIAQWNFNETSGTTAVSGGSCSTSCNGTLTNMTTTGQDAAVGTGWTANNRRWGAGAVMFDGSNDYGITSVNSTNFNSSTSATFEAWVNVKYLNNTYPSILFQNSNTSNEFQIGLVAVQSSKTLAMSVCKRGVACNVVNSGFTVEYGTWYHTVGTFDGTDIKLYINGELQGTTPYSLGTVSDGNDYIFFGSDNTGATTDRFFNGIIDSTRIYSRALSANEILSNYQAGNIEFQYRVSTDNSTWSSWTSYNNGTSDTAWNAFDNAYLYDTTDSGLVGYWPMDEASGTSVADVKGSYTGTATGTIIQPGKFSNSRNFNGTSDYVNIGTSFNVCNGNACTMSAWIKPGSTTGNGYVFAKGNDNSTNSYAILISNQTVATMASATTPTWATSGNVLSAGNWYQIVGVISGQNIYTYVNGALVATNTFTGTIASSTTNARIGNQDRASYYYYFKGNIDEVHVYNTALSASTIARNYILGSSSSSVFSNKPGGIKMEGTNSKRLSNGLADGLVGYWNMNEASGTSVADLAYGQTGTATNTTIVTGKEGNARSFASGYVAVTSPAYVPTGNSAYTMEAWMYPTSTGTCGIVGWGNYGTTNQVNALRLNSSNQIMNYWWGNDLTVTVGTITTSVWHHVAATFDGTTRRIYYDGMLAGSDAPVNHNVPNTSNFRIGSTNGGEYFAGRLDETKIYNIAKTADQIKEEYDTGIVYYANYNLDSTDLSTKSTIPFYIAGDKAGSYISATLGESEYANYQTDSNTVGLWHMEETAGSGAYILDSSGLTGVNLTPTGTTYSSSGKLGGARIFSGSGNYLTVSSGFSQITTLSVSLWFKTSNTTRQTLFGQSSSAPTGAPSSFVPNLVIQTDGKIRAEYWTGAVGAITTTGAYNDGLWHHVEFVGSGTSQQLFVDGASIGTRSGTITQSWWTVTTIGTGYDSTVRGAAASAWQYFNGSIDEVRISNVARTADEIRQAYEVGLRTHPVTIDFGASLVSGNLITGSGDTSFSIDATTQGLPAMGSSLFTEEKVIVRQVVTNVEYIAQGKVASINSSTGATTVASWDSGSTFPSGGFTTSASVFKWEKEYIPVKNRTISTQVDAVSLLTLRVTNTFGGRNIWIDDMRSSTGYLSNYTGETLTFPQSGRYFQYKAILSTWDTDVTPYISRVQLDYAGLSGPTMEQVMRHGKWFSNGTKQSFWWANTP